MKRLIVIAVWTMAMFAGSAYAGGNGSGCIYGGEHAYSGADEQAPVLAAAEEADPKLLAKLKELENTKPLEELIETPVIHN